MQIRHTDIVVNSMVYFYDGFYAFASSQLVTVYFCFVENAVIIYSPSCRFKSIWLAYIQRSTKGDALQKVQTALFHTTKPFSAKKRRIRVLYMVTLSEHFC